MCTIFMHVSVCVWKKGCAAESRNRINWYKSICKSHLWLPCCLFRWMCQSCGSKTFLISGVWLSYAVFSAWDVAGTQSCGNSCKCSFQCLVGATWKASGLAGHLPGDTLPGHSNKTYWGILLCALDAKVGNLACDGTVLLNGNSCLLLLLQIIYY